jgi:hypothetical protein
VVSRLHIGDGIRTSTLFYRLLHRPTYRHTPLEHKDLGDNQYGILFLNTDL